MEFAREMLRDECLEDADVREISCKVDLHRHVDRNNWIFADSVLELHEHYEFVDKNGRRICLGRWGQVCCSRKSHF